MRHVRKTKRRLPWISGGIIAAAAVGAGLLWAPTMAPARGLAITPDVEPAEFSLAAGDVVTVAGGDAAVASLQLSEAIWKSAPIVALATEETLADASAATAGLGLPLLVVPAEPDDVQADALAAELERLGTVAVARAGVTLPTGIDVVDVRLAHLKKSDNAGATPHVLVADEQTRELAEALLRPVGGGADVVGDDPRGAADVVRAIAAVSGPSATSARPRSPSRPSRSWSHASPSRATRPMPRRACATSSTRWPSMRCMSPSITTRAAHTLLR